MVIWHLVKVQDKRNLILLDVLESRTKIGLDPLELKQELMKTISHLQWQICSLVLKFLTPHPPIPDSNNGCDYF